jgi:hypothetical protein
MAQAAGADVMNIKLSQDENHVHNDIDGDLFLETRITATAIGQPMIQKNHSPKSASDLSHDDA